MTLCRGARKSPHAMPLVALILLGSVGIPAQNVKKHKPDFTLTISTEDTTVKAQKNMDISVSVEEKNISRHTVGAGRSSDPVDWYTMSVLVDGHPAPITELYREALTPKRYGPNVARTFAPFLVTIKPGQTQTFEIPLTAFFDLSTPGKYEITFSRGTNRGAPDDVEVKSNTITITVLPPEAQ
jgi:hypothetical protein